MLAKGMWVYEESDDDKRETDAERRARSHHKGFTINSLYSPWLSWSDIASEFIKSKEETELLMNFVNSWLAEVWEEKIEETTVDKVKVLAKDYTQGEVPGGVIVLTAGVDVQKDHFYYVIRGWGYQEESWLVRTGRVEYWEDVADILFKTEYRKITGPERLSVYMSCIDSGYRTDEVYRFCREWPDKAKAIKGQDEISGGRFYRASKIDINSRTGAVIKRGLVLWNLNVSQYKNKISRLVSSKDPQKWHIFKDISDDYLAQFTSEHKILIRNKNTGRAKEEWRKKKEAIANHYLDAEVYAVAAADIIRALNIRTDKAVKVYKENEETMDSRQNWIRKREGTWL
jgi:phage terminase large subunit GpA-like protein